MVRPAQFLGPLQGYQPTLPTPSSRTLRVPPQPRAPALASDLRSSLAMHFLDHGRLLAADDPSTSPYAANALLPMSDVIMARLLREPHHCGPPPLYLQQRPFVLFCPVASCIC